MSQESEFGQGLTYCIGLFLAHTERTREYKKEMASVIGCWPEMWFNGASDHVYDLDTSQIDDDKLREEINAWKEKVLAWGHSFPRKKATEKDVEWSIEKAKEFLRRIDETMLKTKTIQGQWE